MRNLLLACLVIYSFEEAFSQTGYKDADRNQVVKGESSTE